MTKNNLSRRWLIVGVLFAAIFVAAGAANEARAQTGIICGAPGNCQPMFKFKPWDLPFSTGRQGKFKSGETAESNEFYAVVLDSQTIGFSEGDTCTDFTEAKRLRAQKAFPKNKVFASHYCELENVVIYKGFGDWHERNLLAVFVGAVGEEAENMTISETAAQAFLKTARKKYPKAELKKMQAVIDYTRR